MMPWCIPLLDVLKEYYREQDVVAMIYDGTIEIAPLAFMRGRTLKDAWIIADESQNMTPKQKRQTP
jgi:phosphate starvation-inducible PhoH-like protein